MSDEEIDETEVDDTEAEETEPERPAPRKRAAAPSRASQEKALRKIVREEMLGGLDDWVNKNKPASTTRDPERQAGPFEFFKGFLGF